MLPKKIKRIKNFRRMLGKILPMEGTV
jgi:hypothetical protein